MTATHTLKYETSIQDTNSEFCYNMRVTPLDGNFNREESKDFPFTLVEVETDPVTRFYYSGVMSAEEKDRLTALLEKDFRIEYFETYNVKAKLKVSGIPPFPSECKFSMDPIFIDRNVPGRGMLYVSRSHDYVHGFENCRNIKINSLDIDPSYFTRERPCSGIIITVL